MGWSYLNQNTCGCDDNVIRFCVLEMHLTGEIRFQMLNGVRGSSVYLMSVAGWDMGDRLAAFLRSNGVAITSHNRAGLYASAPPHKKPVQISLSDEHADIILDPS